MNVSSEEEEDEMERGRFHATVYGRLTVVLDNQTKTEETYEIFGGENKIGRDPEQSRIVLDNKVIRVNGDDYSAVVGGCQFQFLSKLLKIKLVK